MLTGYSTLDIIKGLNIPRERLRGWMKEGFIKPTVPALGQGTKAIFTLDDVYGIALFQSLISIGFHRKIAAVAMETVRGIYGYPGEEGAIPKNVSSLGLQSCLTDIEYLLLLFKTESGDEIPKILTAGKSSDGKNPLLDLQNVQIIGSEHYVGVGGSDNIKSYSNWSHIHSINFKKLRAHVDGAMKK